MKTRSPEASGGGSGAQETVRGDIAIHEPRWAHAIQSLPFDVKVVARYGLAVGLTGVAFVVRLALAPYLHHQQPFATFFIAVILTAFLAGFGPTLVAFVLGYLTAELFFIEPLHALGPHSSGDLIRLITYLVVCSVVTVGSTLISRARDRAEASRARLEREMAKRKLAEDALREADRRKDEFLGMLSHELRNPLAPIRNSTYILQHAAPGSEQARRAQGVIERQTEHLTRLVDDLLDVTRIARGKIELRRARIDLRDAVWRAADDCRWMMRDRGVGFEVAVPEEQLWADADATRIAQIVGNLLHNASKFTSRGDTVALTMTVTDAVAEIRVRDTGVGIDPDLLPHIFEAFVQGERTLARTAGGLGLGLALVKRITELHSGTVSVESAGKEKGSEFVVRLPLATPVEPAAVPGTHGDRGSAGRRVLVVDDNADAAESLADIVRMLGHFVDVACDGPTAIEKARANPPSVVLCDIGLPGMSGYEVARALRADSTNGMHIFAVSGYAQPEDVKRAIEAGFDGHVAKPCDPEQIERLLG